MKTFFLKLNFPNSHARKPLKSLKNTAQKPKPLALDSHLLSASVKVAADEVTATADEVTVAEIEIETEVIEALVPDTGMIVEMIAIVRHHHLRIGEAHPSVADGAIVDPHLHQSVTDPILLEEDHHPYLARSAVDGALPLLKGRTPVADLAEDTMIAVTDQLIQLQEEM